jgi:hypothetical protein
MWDNKILQKREENSDHQSNNAPIINATSNNDDLSHVKLSDSQNDRVRVAEDAISPFRRVVEVGEDGKVDNDYYEENVEAEHIPTNELGIISTKEQSIYERRFSIESEPYVIPDENDKYIIPLLQSDFLSFGHRVVDKFFRLYDPPAETIKLFGDDELYKRWVNIPNSVFKEDAKYIKKFQDLYDVSKNVKSVRVQLGSGLREFTAFHYEDPTNPAREYVRGTREYVECDIGGAWRSPVIIYRYDLRAAICLTFQKPENDEKVKKVMRPRFYVTYCRLSCNDNERFENHRYTLVSILTTLCSKPYNVYIVWDNRRAYMIEWKTESFIKFFWCDFNSIINAKECLFLNRQLRFHFETHLYNYDYDRDIPRDYHHQGKHIDVLIQITLKI